MKQARTDITDSVFNAWETYSRDAEGYLDEDYAAALKLLTPIAPSLGQLHHLIVKAASGPEYVSDYQAFSPAWTRLGIFVSAGYQGLPQQEIVYDLDTPCLSSLGYQLSGKTLINTGSLGDMVGSFMVGHLINKGTMGDHAGFQMIGTCANQGQIGEEFGRDMLGCNDGRWNVSLALRERFLRDISMPATRETLSNKYRG
jgi:hypothetical protein